MNITFIHNKDCHIWQTAEAALKEALSEAGMPQVYESVVVENDEQAQQYRFFGSPQLTIEGKDVDPTAARAQQFQASGCRVYIWENKMYEYPPKEMILAALQSG